jgi:hypothetical protein
MICEKCHQEKDVIKPFRFVSTNVFRGGTRIPKSYKHIGYLKICDACYPGIEKLYNLGCSKDKQFKRRDILHPILILCGLLLFISFLWFCYIEFGEHLSNGKDPANYTVFVQRPGGLFTTHSAWRIEIDPLPFVALAALVAISGFFAWLVFDTAMDRIYRDSGWVYDLNKEFQVNRHAMSLADRKVYRDTQFAEVELFLTEKLFR